MKKKKEDESAISHTSVNMVHKGCFGGFMTQLMSQKRLTKTSYRAVHYRTEWEGTSTFIKSKMKAPALYIHIVFSYGVFFSLKVTLSKKGISPGNIRSTVSIPLPLGGH